MPIIIITASICVLVILAIFGWPGDGDTISVHNLEAGAAAAGASVALAFGPWGGDL